MFSKCRWIVVAALGLLCLPAPATETKSLEPVSKPNIIFIMADDLGQEALACYGNDINQTPNLDRLAAEGMKFTHAYSTPLCTPTRVQVMTGKYNNRNYLVFGLLNKGEKTFAHYLREAGYATAVAGKWQLLGSEEQQERAGGKRGALPDEAGFDQHCLWQVETLGSRYKNPTITSSTSGTQTYEGAYGPDIFNQFSIEFVRANRDKPFFLYYPMVLTHDPFQPTPDSPEFAAMKTKGVKDPKYFRGQVEYMDIMVGRLADEVAALGLAEKTIFIFTGDNGTGREVESQVNGKPVQGAKGATTKYGTNVPLIVNWKGVIAKGQVNENLLDFTDFLPTFLEAAGATVPAAAGLDGVSILDQLRGKASKVREAVFCYYHPQLRNDRKEIWAHDKTWKLYNDGRFFNFADDPLEQSPLDESSLSDAGKQARIKLQQVLDQNMKVAAPGQ